MITSTAKKVSHIRFNARFVLVISTLIFELFWGKQSSKEAKSSVPKVHVRRLKKNCKMVLNVKGKTVTALIKQRKTALTKRNSGYKLKLTKRDMTDVSSVGSCCLFAWNLIMSHLCSSVCNGDSVCSKSNRMLKVYWLSGMGCFGVSWCLK